MYLEKSYLELEEVFKDMLSIPYIDIEESLPTFLEIAGYPDYENVISNIYQFFLNDVNHGFGRLFLEALDDCIKDKDILVDDYQVRREVYTNKGGRIDLVIEELDSEGNVTKAILIENKIYHSLNNDLSDYLETYAQTKDVTLIVLSLNELDVESPFINITHSQWVSMVEARLGKYMINANLKYLTLLQDFIQHFNRYYEKRIDMDAIKYMFENGHKITQIKLLEQEGIKYIGDEIGKILLQTKWKWGRIIPSGLQIQWDDEPIIGYLNYGNIFNERKYKLQIWLKGEDIIPVIKEKGVLPQLRDLAENKGIKINRSQNTKEWYNVAEKEYSITDSDHIEHIGNHLLNYFQDDWDEFIEQLEKVYLVK